MHVFTSKSKIYKVTLLFTRPVASGGQGGPWLISTASITVKHKSSDVMQLRQRGHNFQLPTIKYEFNKKKFIIRSLFDYV